MDYRTFFHKIIIFTGINLTVLALLLGLASGWNRQLRLPVDETESNLLVTGEKEHYDLVLLGTSRGRVFSRDGNHQVVEDLLGAKVANLSKGGGGGLMPAQLHLSHFFYRGNRADHIVYLVDPWVFFAPINNEENEFFLRDEPFELHILTQLLLQPYPLRQVFAYLQKIPVRNWQEISRYAEPGLATHTLRAIDPDKQEQARKYYRDSYRPESFPQYLSYAQKISEMAADNGATISFIMLPILMTDFPGAKEVDQALTRLATENPQVHYLNLLDQLQDRHLFYDHMHFNRQGIETFCRDILQPLLNRRRAEMQPDRS